MLYFFIYIHASSMLFVFLPPAAHPLLNTKIIHRFIELVD
jgi:hypothetical protein